MNRRGALTVLAGAVLAGAGATGWARTHADADVVDLTVALDWYPNANHAGLFLALERGYYAEESLNVEFYTPSDPKAVLQTVGAGRDMFGISYQTDVLLARAQDVPVVSVAALVQHPLLGVMSLESAEITRPSDLVGATVGYPGIPSQEAFLATMMANDGASIDAVELVNVEFNLLPALISRQTDAVMGAYWTHETIMAEREGYTVRMLRVEAWGVPDYYELVLTANEETINQQPSTVAAFLRATQRGYMEAMADQEAALRALTAAYPETDRDVEERGIELLTSVWMSGIDVYGTQTAERWETYADWMKAQGLIPEDLDPGAAFTTDLLPEPDATPVVDPDSTPIQ
jgi:putative hydroxymethylpyrimidine transport system substrate-binding protein